MQVTYAITVRTGDRFSAGTYGEISIVLRGEQGESGPHVLDNSLRRDFAAGSVGRYEVYGDEVGRLLSVRLRNEPTLIKDDWFLEYLLVELDGVERRFPFHGWLRGGEEVELLEASASLPQRETSEARAAERREALERRREKYPWGPQALPGLGQLDVSDERPLPKDEAYRGLIDRSYHVTFAATMSKLQLARPLLSRAWNALERLKDLLRFVGVPSVAERWTDDREFARHTLQGTSPLALALTLTRPEGMPLSDEALRGLLDPGVSLDEALASRRVFLLDFPLLEGLPMFRKEEKDGAVRERYAPPARALFYRGADEHLRPVAIQIERRPDAPVFTPNDAPNDWLAAKLFVRCAEGNVHQVLAHAINTHFTVEPFLVAAMRNLAFQHPVYKLMRRHFKYTLAINQGARVTLLAPNGVFDDFMSCGGPEMGHMKLALRAWAQWRFEHMRLPDDLRRRGVDDPQTLPYYPYRDDARPLWEILGAYVRNSLGHFYLTDDDVVEDTEAQEFWRDLITHGVPPERLPYASLSRREDLFDLLHTLIFTVTVAHSAVNNLQFEHYAWVPNAPLGLHRPPPTKKGATTDDDIRAMLPDLDQTMGQVAISRALSTFGEDEEFLLPKDQWSRMYFYEPELIAAQRELFSALRAQVARVDEANRHRAVAYEVLRPDRVPCSITI